MIKMVMKVLIVIIIIATSRWTGIVSSPAIIQLPLGKVEGYPSTSYRGRTFFTFLGIPYAKPPIGPYRFKEPQPVEPWTGTLQAKTIFRCMQYSQFVEPGGDAVVGDEDCLYLNIYSPNLNRTAKMDVIFYIHGGAFMFHYGAGQGADFILDNNVVYVNLNYRLGPLGFLSTENDVVPGNNGIRDQIMGLRWVKDNIEYFGGNPHAVTIAGNSAGGASVHIHYLTKKSIGLFQRGISQSGTALNAWVLMEEPLNATKTISASIGCPTEDIEGMVDCLRGRPARQIAHSVKELQPWRYNPFSPFAVVVDTWSSDPVLTDHPYNLIKRGEIIDCPWLVSYTNSEGLYPGFEFYNDDYLEEIDTSWNEIIPLILHYHGTVDPQLMDAVSQKIRKFYLGSKKLSKATFMDFVHILSDRLFNYDIEKASRLQAAVMTTSVYVYYFTYRGARSMFDFTYGADNDLGASHADDIAYMFNTNTKTRSQEEDVKMGDILLTILVSFARYGHPRIGADWPALSQDAADPFVYLKIASPRDLTVETKDFIGNRTFWASLPLKENERLFKIKDEL